VQQHVNELAQIVRMTDACGGGLPPETAMPLLQCCTGSVHRTSTHAAGNNPTFVALFSAALSFHSASRAAVRASLTCKAVQQVKDVHVMHTHQQHHNKKLVQRQAQTRHALAEQCTT
jgi:hypothetical protein